MPIPPPPYTLYCPACDWKKTIAPLSDALRYGIEWFDCCPQCASQPLQKLPASTAELFKEKLQHLIGGRP